MKKNTCLIENIGHKPYTIKLILQSHFFFLANDFSVFSPADFAYDASQMFFFIKTKQN